MIEINPNLPQWQSQKPTGALEQVPSTVNLQSPLGFRFFIKRLPNVAFFVNKMNLPGITLPAAEEATPFMMLPKPGDHVVYEQLVLNFRIDEGMENYFSLQDWLQTIGGLKGGEAYGRLAAKPEYTGYGLESEILVSVLNAQKNVVRNITYSDSWPTQLKLDNIFDAGLTEVQYFSATAIFRFSVMTSSTEV